MSKETRRSLGAITGMCLGYLLMWMSGFQGLVPAFIFLAGGAVAGGISGERLGENK